MRVDWIGLDWVVCRRLKLMLVGVWGGEKGRGREDGEENRW